MSEYIRGRIYIFILYLSRLNFNLISSQQLFQLSWKPVAFVLISRKGVCAYINKYRASYYHQFKLHCWETVNTASLNLKAYSLIWQPIWIKYSLPSFSTVKFVSYNSILTVFWSLNHAPYYYYYYYYYYYEWQLSCHSVAVVLTLVQTKQIRINIYKRNNTKNTVQTIQNTVNINTHTTKTPTLYKTHTYTNPHITKQVKTTTVM